MKIDSRCYGIGWDPRYLSMPREEMGGPYNDVIRVLSRKGPLTIFRASPFYPYPPDLPKSANVQPFPTDASPRDRARIVAAAIHGNPTLRVICLLPLLDAGRKMEGSVGYFLHHYLHDNYYAIAYPTFHPSHLTGNQRIEEGVYDPEPGWYLEDEHGEEIPTTAFRSIVLTLTS
jgi:hypothetical protein